MNCKNCGKKINDGDSFCSYCGVTVAFPKIDSKILNETYEHKVINETKNKSSYSKNDVFYKKPVIIGSCAFIIFIIFILFNGSIFSKKNDNSIRKKYIDNYDEIVDIHELDNNDLLFNCAILLDDHVVELNITYTSNGIINDFQITDDNLLIDKIFINHLDQLYLKHNYQKGYCYIINDSLETSRKINSVINICDNYFREIFNESVYQNDEMDSGLMHRICIRIGSSNIKQRENPSIFYGKHISKVVKNNEYISYKTTHNEGYDWFQLENGNWIANDGTFLEIIEGHFDDVYDDTYSYATILTFNGDTYSCNNIVNGSFVNNTSEKCHKGDIRIALDSAISNGQTFYKIDHTRWVSSNDIELSTVNTYSIKNGIFSIKLNEDTVSYLNNSLKSKKNKKKISKNEIKKVLEIKENGGYLWYKVGSKEWICNKDNSISLCK